MCSNFSKDPALSEDISKKLESTLNLSHPNPGQREKIKYIFIYFFVVLQRFYEGLKGPAKTF